MLLLYCIANGRLQLFAAELLFSRSLGCTVVEMLTGHPPWYKYEGFAAIYRIAISPAPEYELSSSTSLVAKEFLKRCFVKDYQKRPTARELLETDPFVILTWPQPNHSLDKEMFPLKALISVVSHSSLILDVFCTFVTEQQSKEIVFDDTESSYPSFSSTNAHTLGNSCCYYTVDERCAL